MRTACCIFKTPVLNSVRDIDTIDQQLVTLSLSLSPPLSLSLSQFTQTWLSDLTQKMTTWKLTAGREHIAKVHKIKLGKYWELVKLCKSQRWRAYDESIE